MVQLQTRRPEDEMFQDLRYGVRMMFKNRAVTAIAVLSLALGIGANTALFSLVDAVLLKTLPVKEPEQLVLFRWISGPERMSHLVSGEIKDIPGTGLQTGVSFSYQTFEQFRARNQTLSDIFAFAPLTQLNVSVNGQAEIASGQVVSGGYYAGLGVRLQLGRPITDSDDHPSASPVAVISHRYWGRRFGNDPGVIGKTVNVNNTVFTIIGVAPPEFHGALQVGDDPDLSIPLTMEPLVRAGGRNYALRDAPLAWWVQIMGRLKPGVSAAQVDAELEGVMQRTVSDAWQAAAARDGNNEAKDLPSLSVTPGSQGLTDLRQDYAQPLRILMVVVGLVLLIACANVANLLLARAASRQKEIAVRLALGAGRLRLVRQLLTESVLLAVTGGALGVLFAFWGKDALLVLRPDGGKPLELDLSIDLRVLSFTLLVSLLTGVLFGLAPAWRATRVDLNQSLKESGRTGSGISPSLLSKSLVVAQVAISLVLLVGACLFVLTLRNLQNVNAGFNRENLLFFSVDPRLNGYDGARINALYQQMVERIEAIPGVRSVSHSEHSLLGGGGWATIITVQGRTESNPADGFYLRWNFFKTMEMPILRGRTLTPQDDANAPKVAVVNETLARRIFPNEDALGKRFVIGRLGPDAASSPERLIEIVGIVRDAKYRDLRQETPPAIFLLAIQNSAVRRMTFEVRTTSQPTAMISAIRETVRQLDSNLPLFEFTTQNVQAETTLAQERLFARLTTVFGLLALLLASIGLYGVMAYSVAQRKREIGIRMALGARKHEVLKLIIRQGMGLVVLGAGAGSITAFNLTRLVSSQLFGVKASDPLTFIGVTLLLTGVALVACWIPARRAAKIDPMTVLRHE
jgi:predicted permease